MNQYEQDLRAAIQWEIDIFKIPIIRDVANLFCDLTNEQRCEIMNLCCKHCGTLASPCHCMNDE